MEFAAAALTSLASSVGSAVSTVGTAASSIGSTVSGATSAIGGASTFANILQGGAGLVGALASVRSGNAQAEAYRQAATEAEQERTTAATDATNSQNSLRKSLISSLGERDVAYAASGVDLSFGTPVQARQQAETDTSNALTQSQDDLVAKQQRLTARAAAYRAQASEASTSGWLKGGASLLTAGAGIYGRK